MSEEVDEENMQKCLKEANLFEENMSNEMMMQYYKAIKDSETSMQEESKRKSFFDSEADKSLNESANELLEAINNSESIAPSHKRPKTPSESSETMDEFEIVPNSASLKESRDRPSLIGEESNNNNNIDVVTAKNSDKGPRAKSKAEIIKDINKISFHDMPESDKSNKNMLKITCHKLKYVAVQNTKSFIIGSTEMKIKMIRDYHKAVDKLRAHHARLSNVKAPLGKPIVIQYFESNSQDFNLETLMDGDDKDVEDEPMLSKYISRSGRITKRKVYEEQDDSSQDSVPATKPDKNNDNWISKSKPKEKTNKPPVKKLNSKENNKENCTDKSQKLKNKRSESPESTVSSGDFTGLTDFLNRKDPDPFDALKENSVITSSSSQNSKPQRPGPKKKQTNNDFISRSPMFRDSPKSSRTNAMLNAAREETEKKKQQENEIEKFKSSLDVESQALDIDLDDFVDLEPTVEKKRIVPPLPGRKAVVNSRKRTADSAAALQEPLNIVTKKPNLNPGDSSKVTRENGVSKKAAPAKKAEASTAKASTPKRNVTMTPCPLCSLSFPLREIEDHAATCGEDMFPQAVHTQRITCQFCDCVIMCNKDLEAHVQACKEKSNLLK